MTTPNTGLQVAESYNAEILETHDYYAFGYDMPGRNVNQDYQYSFNGQREDSWDGNHDSYLDFGERMYDSRLGRFMSPDPLEEEFPWQSPYNGIDDSPIYLMDIDGESAVSPNEDGDGGKNQRGDKPSKNGWESDVNVVRDETGNIEPGQEGWDMRHAPKQYVIWSTQEGSENVDKSIPNSETVVIPSPNQKIPNNKIPSIPRPKIKIPDPEGMDNNKSTTHWGWAGHLSLFPDRQDGPPTRGGFVIIEWSIGNPDYNLFGKKRPDSALKIYHTVGGTRLKHNERVRKWTGKHHKKPLLRHIREPRYHFFGFFMNMNQTQRDILFNKMKAAGQIGDTVPGQ